MDGIDNYASALPGLTSYNWVLNNPNVFVDPDGNQATTYTGGPDNSGDPGFDNGFTGASFRRHQGDFDLSMMNMGARCYNQTIGRFLGNGKR